MTCGGMEDAMERTLTCALLKALIADQARIALLDVRRRHAFEVEPGLIPGAVWRDPEQVDRWAAELNPHRSVVVYCVHGHEVSHGVAARLRNLGIEAVLLKGGIEAWKAAGGPVIASSGGAMS
jgi:rhodanese-related sulfurtransferase